MRAGPLPCFFVVVAAGFVHDRGTARRYFWRIKMIKRNYDPVKFTAHDFVSQLSNISNGRMNSNNFLLALSRFAELEECEKTKVIERFAVMLEEGKTYPWHIDDMIFGD